MVTSMFLIRVLRERGSCSARDGRGSAGSGDSAGGGSAEHRRYLYPFSQQPIRKIEVVVHYNQP